jgi:predicted Zn-dependent peptidase
MQLRGFSTRLLVAAWLLAVSPLAALDLERAEVEVLDNGLTLVVLAEPMMPLVSVQMLYRVGARNEEVGRTGLAHFLEHMAFRATENFPDTDVVSSIYAVGGEWHGYTWIDQTTYFETVPKEYLDLALRIEADRMARLLIPAEEVSAERGAVLSELHGYENDPGTVLLDTVVATSFLQHPYRNNTIGWESDVESLEYRDVVEFYRRHYHPSNAVLAIVGDVQADHVRGLVEQHFGGLDSADPTPQPRTIEPAQEGERRVQVRGPAGLRRFVIAYRAPSVRSPDWPAFLVLQEILGGGEGVNFLQNEWGVTVQPGTRLEGIVEDLSTWYPPSFDRYLFVLSGSPADGRLEAEVESDIEARIASLRRSLIAGEELAAAQARVARQLIFDLETTEDAAHQLATFVGFGALPELLDLPAAVERVTRQDIQRLSQAYLQPWQRTIGWYLPESANPPDAQTPAGLSTQSSVATPPIGGGSVERSLHPAGPVGGFEAPVIRRLSNGLPVIFQRTSMTPAAYLSVLMPSTATEYPGETRYDWPIWGHTSVERRFLVEELDAAVWDVRSALQAGVPRSIPLSETIEDPEQRLTSACETLLGLARDATAREPRLIALVGALDLSASLEVLERAFGSLQPGGDPAKQDLQLAAREATIRLPVTKAQAQLGYVVPAPPPSSDESLAWRMLLYVLTHGYEGRLGKEAIGRRGLLYYIDSAYRTDGVTAWITLQMGVDPPKLAPLRELLVATLRELEAQPASSAELEEARQHLIGRRRSAAQSNAEISAALVREWVEQGRLLSEEEFVRAVMEVQPEAVLAAIPDFVAGAIVVVENPE